MPRLSLYHPTKTQDYTFIDRLVSEQLTVGGTDLYIHKYLGPTNQGPSIDYTQPQYDTLNPTNIQDLLFLENRDRSYDPNIYRLRGHYLIQNLDFDLSQFGLFLNNNIIFIVVHYNDMIQLIGRKLMVGDVVELPHLLDYDPLDATGIPKPLKRFMQITDTNFASEGFSPTWYPHLWRLKCEPLVNSEEFSQILSAPVNEDNYLGIWDKGKGYPQGYTITFGDKNYISLKPVPAGISPPNPEYWKLDDNKNLADILSTYNKNISINDAALAEAQRIVPHSGYENSNLWVMPTYGVYESNDVLSNKLNQPAPPIDVLTYSGTAGSDIIMGSVEFVNNPNYRFTSGVLRVSKQMLDNLKSKTTIDKFKVTNLKVITTAPEKLSTGSGFVSGNKLLQLTSPPTNIQGPYGTADNTYATADQDPTAPNFTGTQPYGPNTMDYRADCDPRFQYIARSTPRSFGYSAGYLTGDAKAPNGVPVGAGIAFPANPQVGDYFLRIDYKPQILYRWDGKLWIRISEKVRTETGFSDLAKETQVQGFINNSNVTTLTSGAIIPQKQSLSGILQQSPPTLPPIVD